jgi:NAD(P)-dependent dehydrogenase (short-subunit alcohol dehydrogenase family)
VRCGARVYIASRKVQACESAEQKLSEYGYCRAIPCDISTVEGCGKLAAEMSARENKLDILVNNAGLTWSAGIDDFPEKAWDKVMDLDVKSPFFLTQQLLPQLRAAGSADQPACVINIASINAIRPGNLRNYSYVAAKAGLCQLSVQMARDLVDAHINVNVIAPGMFKSKMTAPLYANTEIEQEAIKPIPMQAWGALENIAGLTIFLASKAGAYLTGTIIPCDGGVTTLI